MTNEQISIFFQVISFFGTPFFYMPAAAFLFKINPELAIRLAFSIIITEVICGAIKFIYPKERPIPMPRKTIFQKYLAGSFPSVHTARITTLVTTIALPNPNKIMILAAFMAISLVGYSRIYLKKHYLIDVIAGFLIGSLISIGTLMI